MTASASKAVGPVFGRRLVPVQARGGERSSTGRGLVELAQSLESRGGPADLVEALVALARAVDAGEAVAVVVGVTDPERALSSQEVADLLNVSRPYVVKLAREGVLPFHKVGNRHRFRAADVLAYERLEDGRRAQILAGLAPGDGYRQEDF